MDKFIKILILMLALLSVQLRATAGDAVHIYDDEEVSDAFYKTIQTQVQVESQDWMPAPQTSNDSTDDNPELGGITRPAPIGDGLFPFLFAIFGYVVWRVRKSRVFL